MPWTTDKVDEHKKGLTSEQKKKWVAIANSVLESCQKEGKRNDCDAVAIRIANGKVGEVENNVLLQVNFLETIGYIPEMRNWNDKEYIIVPAVMMVEGVHHGSHGPLFHPIDELARIAIAGNGKPVTINHPQDNDGWYISANDPQVLTNWSVGQVFNIHVDENKLKGELWIETNKIEKLNPEALAKIRLGQPMEVSIGLISDENYEEGDWNNEHYIAISRNHRLDHIALLPVDIGACSMKDGCGLRVNYNSGTYTDTSISGVTGDTITVEEEQSSQVAKTIIVHDEKGGKTMCQPCKEKVDMLLTHEATSFTEDDREWLEALTEDKLDKMIPKVITVQTEVKVPPTIDEAWEMILKDLTAFVSRVPEEAKVQINAEMKAKEERQAIVESLIANTEWQEDELNSMSLEVLKKLEITVNKAVTNYALKGARGNTGGGKVVAPMPLPGVKFEN